MEHDHVLSGLIRKRGELAGELIAAEKRIAQIRIDLECIDGAIRVFDPEAVPTSIKPRRIMTEPLTLMPHGQASREILGILRTAQGNRVS